MYQNYVWRWKKQSEENTIKIIRIVFILKNEAIKDIIIKDIRTLLKQKDDYYKPIRKVKFWNNSYIKYESSGDRNESLSVKEYLNPS